jgi:hypothetical protein
MNKFTRNLLFPAWIILLISLGFGAINKAEPTAEIKINTKGTEAQQIYTIEPEDRVAFSIYIPIVFNVEPQYYIKLPSLESFAESLDNGQNEIIRGVYVNDVLALRVIQQPDGDPNFIDDAQDVANQFGAAAQFGTIGLLAHNDRAGRYFYNVRLM